MATTQEYYNYIMECLEKVGNITSRKMMGEYCLYYKEVLFGGIYDNRLLVKKTESSEKKLFNCKLELPYEGSKSPMFLVSEFENVDFMRNLLEVLYTDLGKKRI